MNREWLVSKQAMRNEWTRASVIKFYIERRLREVYPLGVPANLILPHQLAFLRYGYKPERPKSRPPRLVPLYLRWLQKAAVLLDLRARRGIKTLPAMQVEYAGREPEITI